MISFKKMLTAGAIASAAFAGVNYSADHTQGANTTNDDGGVGTSQADQSGQEQKGGVQLTDINFYTDPTTRYAYVYGIVHNNTDKWLSIECSVSFLDASGKALDIGGWYATHEEERQPGSEAASPSVESFPVAVIPPHGKGVLHHMRDPSKINGKAVNAKVWVSETSETGEGVRFGTPSFNYERYFEKLTKYDGTVSEVDLGYVITGSVTNVGTKPATSPILAILTYDPNGKIVDVHEMCLDCAPITRSKYDISGYKHLLVSTQKEGAIATNETRRFEGYHKWHQTADRTMPISKMEAIVYDEAYVD